MHKNINKILPFLSIIIIILFLYVLMFFGVTYTFKSKSDTNAQQTNSIVDFNKTFDNTEVDSINIISDFSNVVIEENTDNNLIEIYSKYNKISFFFIQLKMKKLTIKQYSNNAKDQTDNKYLVIRLPSKDFKKLKISSNILNVRVNTCKFESINIKSKIATIDLILKKTPHKIKLFLEMGNIRLNIPKSKNNEFKINTIKSSLSFYDKKYLGLINKKIGIGSNFIDIFCEVGSIFIY